jgi:hypothetical protein
VPHGVAPTPASSEGRAVFPNPRIRTPIAPPVEVSPRGIASSQEQTLVAGASGIVTMQFTPEPIGTHVELELVVVSSTSTTPTVATVYAGSVDPQNVRDYTPSGNADISNEAPPIFIPGGRRITIQWTGVSAGASCTGAIQYRLMGV